MKIIPKVIHIVFKEGNEKSQCFYSESWNEFPESYKLYALKTAISKLQDEYNMQKLFIDNSESEIANDDDSFVYYV